MTEQETYIAGQKAFGIEVGDTVRATRHFRGGEAGHGGGDSDVWPHKSEFIDAGATGIVTRKLGTCIEVDCGAQYDHLWNFPYFVLEIVKKANGSKPINTITGERTMSTKEQTLFNVAVTENQHEYNGETGLIESTTKKVLYAKPVLPAFTKENAHTQAVVATVKANPNAEINWAEVEVKVSQPFCE